MYKITALVLIIALTGNVSANEARGMMQTVGSWLKVLPNLSTIPIVANNTMYVISQEWTRLNTEARSQIISSTRSELSSILHEIRKSTETFIDGELSMAKIKKFASDIGTQYARLIKFIPEFQTKLAKFITTEFPKSFAKIRNALQRPSLLLR